MGPVSLQQQVVAFFSTPYQRVSVLSTIYGEGE